MRIETTHNNSYYDSFTGNRISKGKKVLITDLSNRVGTKSGTRTKVIGEDTIVWLAEQIGLRVVDGDAGDSGDAASVDAGDVESGGGEVKAGTVKAGGRKAAKRRSDGPVASE